MFSIQFVKLAHCIGTKMFKILIETNLIMPVLIKIHLFLLQIVSVHFRSGTFQINRNKYHIYNLEVLFLVLVLFGM